MEAMFCLQTMVGLTANEVAQILKYLLTNFPEMKINTVCRLLLWWVS